MALTLRLAIGACIWGLHCWDTGRGAGVDFTFPLAQNTRCTAQNAHHILNDIGLDAVRLLNGAAQQAARQKREHRREPGDKAIGKIVAGFRPLARHAAGFH